MDFAVSKRPVADAIEKGPYEISVARRPLKALPHITRA